MRTATPMRTVTGGAYRSISTFKRLLRLITRPSPGSLTTRSLAQVRREPFSELWFTAALPARASNSTSDYTRDGSLVNVDSRSIPGGNGSDHKPPDERTVKLGRTLRTLSPLLPNILTTPLAAELLSPNVSLHLFPSTHPHLPVVKGKMPYRAALWTAPVAWGCVPMLGNTKLDIISEKIVRSGFITAPTLVEQESENIGEEKLVVKWRTIPKTNGGGSTISTSSTSTSSALNGGTNGGLSTLLGGNKPLFSRDGDTDAFSGLFVFSFDKEGRIASHTIEHADEANGFDKTSRVVTLTDWLLGKARWRTIGEDHGLPVPGLAYKLRMLRVEVKKPPHWRTPR